MLVFSVESDDWVAIAEADLTWQMETMQAEHLPANLLLLSKNSPWYNLREHFMKRSILALTRTCYWRWDKVMMILTKLMLYFDLKK